MILIIDACSIANLVNSTQDDSLFSLLRRCFKEIYIAREIIDKEIKGAFSDYKSYYDSPQEIKQLISQLKLHSLISPFDSNKNDCIELVKSFYGRAGEDYLKVTTGEFYSTLLALYHSREVVESFGYNTNRILLATDDYEAGRLYKKIFNVNQIGKIIDTIDLLTIFYLKKYMTKRDLLKYTHNIIKLYELPLNELLITIENEKKKETNSSYQSLLSDLLDKVNKNDSTELNIDGSLNKLYKKYPTIKNQIRKLQNYPVGEKVRYLKNRYNYIYSDCIWQKS